MSIVKDRVVMRMAISVIIAALGVLCLCPEAAFAQNVDQRFCVVPVAHGASGDGPVGETWRLTTNRFDIPGLPAPVFTPSSGFAGPWTVDAERRLIPYQGPFPRTYLDTATWVREPWSGRVVAPADGGVAVLAPGADRFEKIAPRLSGKGYGPVTVLPHRRLTVAVENGSALAVVGPGTLAPWLSADELSAHGVHGILALYGSSLLSALIILDAQNTLHVLTDEGNWYGIGTVGKSIGGYFVDAAGSNSAMLFLDHSVVAIRKKITGAAVSFVSEMIESGATPSGEIFYVSKLFGQLLAYNSRWFGSSRWQRLTSDGFADVAGGDVRIPQKPFMTPPTYVHDLPTLGKTLIEGAEGLYVYDGTKIEPVKGGDRRTYGDLSKVYDLPSIGRVLVVARAGIFELTRAGELIARPMPFPTGGKFAKPQLADWPGASVALISTERGIFALDHDLTTTAVPGGDQVELGGVDFALGEMASTGDLILYGDRGIFLAVDGRGAGAAACQHERVLRQTIPDSTLCLRGIPGTDEGSIGFAIGGLAEAPGGRGLLVDTVNGLFLEHPDGSFENIEPRGGQYTRDLVPLPGTGDVLATGPNSTVVRADLSLERLGDWIVPKAVSRAIGGAVVTIGDDHRPNLVARLESGKYRVQKLGMEDIEAAVDAPWFGGALVWSRRGLSLLHRDGSVVPFEAANMSGPLRAPSTAFYSRVLFGVSDLFSLDRFQTIFVRQQQGGWFRLTGDRQWLPVHGLPNDLVLARFDPGRGEVLLGLSSGIYAVDADGEARKLGGPGAPSHTVRALAGTVDRIVAGGDDGLFEISKDLSRIVPVAHGSVDLIGSVLDIVDAGFAGIAIVESANGTYAFEDGELTRVRDLSAAARVEKLTALPAIRRVVATKRFVAGALLFDLGRGDRGDRCRDPLASGALR